MPTCRLNMLLSAVVTASFWLLAPLASQANQNPCSGEMTDAIITAPCPREQTSEQPMRVLRPCPQEEAQNPCPGE